MYWSSLSTVNRCCRPTNANLCPSSARVSCSRSVRARSVARSVSPRKSKT